MTLRALVVMLVLANLGFAAWALLIDRPVEVAAARDISRLPTLMLASDAASAAPAAAKHAAGAPTAGGPTTPARCVTVGPFADLAAAAAASALLQSRGFTPTQRDEAGPDLIAYSVYLDDVQSEAAATRVLQKLHSNGIADARVMPIATAAQALRVSVGLFNERKGAERRVKQVKTLGLSAAISEQHQPQATYWVNINLSSPGQSVSTEGLLPPAAADAHLEISDCPTPPSSAPAPAGASPK